MPLQVVCGNQRDAQTKAERMRHCDSFEQGDSKTGCVGYRNGRNARQKRRASSQHARQRNGVQAACDFGNNPAMRGMFGILGDFLVKRNA